LQTTARVLGSQPGQNLIESHTAAIGGNAQSK